VAAVSRCAAADGRAGTSARPPSTPPSCVGACSAWSGDPARAGAPGPAAAGGGDAGGDAWANTALTAGRKADAPGVDDRLLGGPLLPPEFDLASPGPGARPASPAPARPPGAVVPGVRPSPCLRCQNEDPPGLSR